MDSEWRKNFESNVKLVRDFEITTRKVILKTRFEDQGRKQL